MTTLLDFALYMAQLELLMSFTAEDTGGVPGGQVQWSSSF